MKSILLFLALLSFSLPALAEENRESAYDRIMKTNTIRCGWGTNDPWISKDPNTQKMQGLYVETMESLANHLDWKLDWPEETGWADLPTALHSGRVDVACSTLWNDPVRGKYVAYTQPLYYTALYVYAREDDARFTGKTQEINSPDIRVVVLEGDISGILADRYFPNATRTAISNLSSAADAYLNVSANKADIVIGDPISIMNFNANNEKKLKKIPFPRPITVYGNSLAVGIQEGQLKEVLDNTVRFMIQTGEIEELTKEFRKKYPDAIVLPNIPYTTGK